MILHLAVAARWPTQWEDSRRAIEVDAIYRIISVTHDPSSNPPLAVWGASYGQPGRILAILDNHGRLDTQEILAINLSQDPSHPPMTWLIQMIPGSYMDKTVLTCSLKIH